MNDIVEEPGYLFSYTYGLEEDEIIKLINDVVKTLEKDFGNFMVKVNVVKNKHDEKLGYSYIWVNNIEVYNAIIGLNLDGSKRLEKTETKTPIVSTTLSPFASIGKKS